MRPIFHHLALVALILLACVTPSRSALAGCEKVQDMVAADYPGRGHKHKWCAAKGYTSLIPVYKEHGDGGYCYRGQLEDCRSFVLHALTAKKKTWTKADDDTYNASKGQCDAKVAIRSLGYDHGHKHKFCLARGFDSVYDGTWCFKGPEKQCRKLEISSVSNPPGTPSNPAPIAADCACPGNTGTFLLYTHTQRMGLRPGISVAAQASGCSYPSVCGQNAFITGQWRGTIDSITTNDHMVYKMMIVVKPTR